MNRDPDVLAEKHEEAHQPLDREPNQAAAKKHRDLRLVDSQNFGGFFLGEPALPDEDGDLVGQFGFGERLFGVRQAEIGEDISAADYVIRLVLGHGLPTKSRSFIF